MKYTFLIFGLLLLTNCYSQENLIAKKYSRKAELFMRNPYPKPWLSPTKKSIIKNGYQISMRMPHPSLEKLPTLLNKIKNEPAITEEKILF